MMKVQRQIVSLYLSNPTFLVLGVFFVISMVASKVLFHSGYVYYADETFSILFVASLWLAFYFGMMVKRQFANHRASLLPNYRRAHIRTGILIYLALILGGYIWMFGYRSVVETTAQGLWGIYVTCLLIALVITWLGYLSMARTLIYAYVFLLIFANQSMNVIELLSGTDYLAGVLAAVFFVSVFFFIKRLSQVKEDDFEYDYMFSWPPRSLIINQLRASETITGALSTWIPTKGKANLPIPQYPRRSNIFARAYHWDYTEHADFKVIWTLMLLAVPLVLLMNKNIGSDGFTADVYSNFLLLSFSPVLITVASHYRRMAYWGYDILKPVDKKDYMRQQGVVIFTSLVLYWTLFAVCFALIPSIMNKPDVFAAWQFWLYLLYTLNFSFMVLCWLALLSCTANPIFVIMQGILLTCAALFLLYCMPGFSADQMIANNIVCLTAGLFFCRRAYLAWCEKEFEN
ncbi:MAG: hypothetical protein KA403_09960 [Candidatus Omnitrophica bacterium]|nr:hypothetical protein [Candidatus Omnitrophota bacterium]